MYYRYVYYVIMYHLYIERIYNVPGRYDTIVLMSGVLVSRRLNRRIITWQGLLLIPINTAVAGCLCIMNSPGRLL